MAMLKICGQCGAVIGIWEWRREKNASGGAEVDSGILAASRNGFIHSERGADAEGMRSANGCKSATYTRNAETDAPVGQSRIPRY